MDRRQLPEIEKILPREKTFELSNSTKWDETKWLWIWLWRIWLWKLWLWLWRRKEKSIFDWFKRS